MVAMMTRAPPRKPEAGIFGQEPPAEVPRVMENRDHDPVEQLASEYADVFDGGVWPLRCQLTNTMVRQVIGTSALLA